MAKKKAPVEKVVCAYDDPCRCIRPAITPQDVADRRTAQEFINRCEDGTIREWLRNLRSKAKGVEETEQ